MLPIEQKAMKPEIIKKIDESGIIAVLVIDEVKHAVPLANAFLKGGVNAIELTLRTPAALEAAETIKKNCPEINLGIGTVLTVEQVKAIASLGVDFAVAPGYNPRVVEAAQKYGVSFAPGVTTASELEGAVEQGCRILKYFPAEPIGGMNYLSNMVAPYQYLGLKFIPLGGVNMDNAAGYIKSDLITAIGGSWLAKRPLIQAENWDAITANAKEITSLISEIRSK
ncbi:bifunctional 4-hydroxy-2-oxoglutarate aldolase/2-dehydro-3-deoxy-phosphogluconate aldolase [uncultured Draconibacterium sp.]|uniref:bifunctional 4-hydroxy-2-oxoglutarate aldolase/2-dehydro-3-deoxy-phosphogluconate aldolase n=1 Tax=uncultured Draconibacterium sp. TaxID=1573823 RepID=UPI0025EDA9E1|nr:bifunctional 4-hydroxy-2-oxoglutarate aldolase/2-dehydro-3-deoxy-phosphogluconate aldolase [uncultured Draconibacterium sp.]